MTNRNVLWAALLLAGSAQADVFSVNWQYPAVPTVPIQGFRIYCGLQPGEYDEQPVAVAAAADRVATVTLAQGDKRHCVVAAYNETGDSLPSNELTLASKPNAPVGFTVTAMSPEGTVETAVPPARAQGVRVRPLPAPR